MKFGIIIAFFNSNELWVQRCLDSIFSNNYENFEIVMINDGSSIECTTKIEKLVKKYKTNKIKIIKIEHSGNSIAKHKGYECLSDDVDYVWYIDSDDYIKDYSFSKLNYFLTKYKDIDMLNFDFDNLFHNNNDFNYHIFQNCRKRKVQSSVINLTNYEFKKFQNKYFFIDEWEWSCCLSIYRKKF